jgi:hypothetical protein
MLMWLPKYLFGFRGSLGAAAGILRAATSTRFFLMDANNKCSETPPVPASKKKPYVKPSFRCEKVFGTTAPSCGKTPNSSFQYNIDPKAS